MVDKKDARNKDERKNDARKKDESLKYEIANELGLGEKVGKLGWKGLSAKETGRIGGLMNKRRKLES